MGGLALAKVDSSTWVNWTFNVVLSIGLAAMAILTIASIIL